MESFHLQCQKVSEDLSTTTKQLMSVQVCGSQWILSVEEGKNKFFQTKVDFCFCHILTNFCGDNHLTKPKLTQW